MLPLPEIKLAKCRPRQMEDGRIDPFHLSAMGRFLDLKTHCPQDKGRFSFVYFCGLTILFVIMTHYIASAFCGLGFVLLFVFLIMHGQR